MKNLAIVIPAYKPNFLDKTLESLSNQTNKDFKVYIGDDCSPYKIEEIVNKYKDNIDIEYKRFDTNVGGKNLVYQWRRCIEMTKEEPWLCLFSDDDTMCPNVIETFYREIEKGEKAEIYHFDVNVIDKEDKISQDRSYKKELFPDNLTSKEYATKRLKYEINSFVVEYIFSRKIYEEKGGFEEFDLAWGSDDATWIKFGENKGIKTIKGAKINWRLSDVNITPQRNAETAARKLNATIDYLNFVSENIKGGIGEYLLYNYFVHSLYNAMKACKWEDIKESIIKYKTTRTDYVPLTIYHLISKLLRA